MKAVPLGSRAIQCCWLQTPVLRSQCPCRSCSVLRLAGKPAEEPRETRVLEQEQVPGLLPELLLEQEREPEELPQQGQEPAGQEQQLPEEQGQEHQASSEGNPKQQVELEEDSPSPKEELLQEDSPKLRVVPWEDNPIHHRPMQARACPIRVLREASEGSQPAAAQESHPWAQRQELVRPEEEQQLQVQEPVPVPGEPLLTLASVPAGHWAEEPRCNLEQSEEETSRA
jgi:hypothetical protein